MSTVPQKLGQYELRQQLGRGNIGEVWQAYDLQNKRDVAVKVLYTDLQSDPNFLKRFTSEGQKIVALRHDNIASVYDVATAQQETGTTAYIASAYIAGQSLEKFIAEKHTTGTLLSLPDIVYLFTSLGVAIDYAHQQGIVHGDIKPSNILFDSQKTERFALGEPMLTDFGLQLLLGDSVSIGTPHYMSPEGARGDALNNRSDIYSLGVILYELCTGVKPFRDESSVAVMMQHMNTLPTPPILINSQLPTALSEVILRAMAKDTATRYPIASLFATAIADACSIRPAITLPRIAVAEEESTYSATGKHYGSLLGVSQPTGPTRPVAPPATPRIYPQTTRPVAPPATPRIYPQTTRPKVPAATTSALPGPETSSKQRIMPPIPAPITQKISITTPLPNGTSLNTGILQSSRPTTSPEKTTQPSMVTQAYAPTQAPQTSSSATFPTTPRTKRSRITDLPVYAILAVFALILLIAAGVIGSMLLNAKNTASNEVVGNVFFQDDALGRADVLRLDLQNITAPPQDKVYQAWLQRNDNTALSLGTLAPNNNNATLLYPGDANHTNLLSVVQAVLVTTENAGQKQTTPGTDVVYKAGVDKTAFQHIKNILYQTPGLPGNGSVIVNMFETIKSINDKAGSLVDSIQSTHDYALAKRQATRIIELVDGSAYAKASGDLPKDAPSQVYAQLGLLSSPSQPGYLDLLSQQLDKLQPATGDNASMQQHIQNVRNAITNLRDWIQKLRTYDRPLVQAANIANPALIANALHVKQLASDTYTGRIIPPNDEPRPILGSAGAYQAYVECQFLATLDVKKVG